MFLAVYLHHTPVCFDNMLGRFFESGEYELPGDTEGYLIMMMFIHLPSATVR